jgi:hypothetical protein
MTNFDTVQITAKAGFQLIRVHGGVKGNGEFITVLSVMTCPFSHVFLLLLLLLLPFVLCPATCFRSEVILNYGAHRQSVWLLGLVISPVARSLPTQDKSNTEETRRDIYASIWFEPTIPVPEWARPLSSAFRNLKYEFLREYNQEAYSVY